MKKFFLWWISKPKEKNTLSPKNESIRLITLHLKSQIYHEHYTLNIIKNF
jgi:hypothetical protein